MSAQQKQQKTTSGCWGTSPALLVSGALIFVALFAVVPAELPANTCAAPPRLKIRGAPLGRGTDASGAIVLTVGLRVVDDQGLVVGEAGTNSVGNFRLAPLPKGKDRITTTERRFWEDVGEIEISSSNQGGCTRPISAVLVFLACGGGVSNHRPRDWHEPGW
jgi:hypothetical protein